MSTVIASECRAPAFRFNAACLSAIFWKCRLFEAANPKNANQRQESVMPLTRKLAAEFIGTFWLVLGGCGSAVLAAAFPHVGIGLVGVSLAFGLTIVAMAYAIGDVSGWYLFKAGPCRSFGCFGWRRCSAVRSVRWFTALSRRAKG
jgi:hypothetical protein